MAIVLPQGRFNNTSDKHIGEFIAQHARILAASEKGGKDNSGDYIYVKNGRGQYKLDKNGHLIVDHDLHSHDGELPDGIAEAFIEWAKSEKLSFWVEG